MPWRRERYPQNWEMFSADVRVNRAHGRCECTGECGYHNKFRTEPRCLEEDKCAAQFFRGTVHLTTAHLCACDPPCANYEHVKAMCQGCHLRLDATRKADARRARRHAALQEHADLHGTIGELT
jgi:hypothetical protein